jgi:thiamine-phosphate pyrophosphorylase
LQEAKPIVCYVTDRKALGEPGPAGSPVLRVIERAISSGVDCIQIREKDLPAAALLALARQAVRAAQDTATKIIVNDRLDVALAAGAAGVHLGGESLRVAEVKVWCARRRGAEQPFLVGASCHALEEALAAERDGADYLFFGPVFPTPAKLQYGPPQGIEELAEVCRRVRIPVLAIGGVTPENAQSCLSAGAAGVAAIRLFQESLDLATILGQLRGT